MTVLIVIITVEVEDLTGVRIDEDEANMELQSALDKARKLKQKKDKLNPDKVSNLISSRKEHMIMVPFVHLSEHTSIL